MRRLGQHFLSDPAILARIADALDCVPGETVVEIGPGHGTLTRELLARGVRLALESERPIAQIAADLGIHPEALRKRVRQAEADGGKRPELLSSAEREEIRRLRKVYELRRANEILKSASVFFAKELDPDRPK